MNCPHCGQPITMPEGDNATSKNLFDIIEDEVIRYYGIEKKQLYGKSRYKGIVDARHTFIYLLYRVARYGKSKIARILRKHHTTIILTLRKMENMIDTQDYLATDLLRLKTAINRDIENMKTELHAA